MAYRSSPALVLFAALAVASCTRPAEPRPDILLVTIDTLRADHTSVYGYPVDTTPNLARLAEEGVVFRVAYSPTSTTGPSHFTLLSSNHPRSKGVLKNGQKVADDALMLPEALREHGYTTAAFVSSLPVRSRFGFDQGFQFFDENFRSDDASIGRQKAKVPHDRRADATARGFLSWMERRDPEERLFAWVHFVDPHAPYKAPEPFKARWPRGTKGYIRRYDGEIRFADRWLREVVDAMRARSTPDGTLIVVTSDHGEGLGDHDWMAHGVNLYEEAVRVPLVASWPGHLPAGTDVTDMVSLIDVAPGIVGLLGIEKPSGWAGESLFARPAGERPVFLQRRAYASRKEKGRKIRGELFGVVSGGHKLLIAEEEDRLELFDLAEDPRELDNRAPAQPGAVSERRQRIVDWQRDFPVPDHEPEGPSKEDMEALRSLGYVD
jgi:arylsulfatase A-like enzyme